MSSDSNTYTLKREYFGGNINLKNREMDSLKEATFKSEPHLDKNFEQKNPKTITLGNIVEKSYHKVHTEKTKTQTKLIKHLEGGWPSEVKDPTEQREVNNWKRTMEKKEDFFPKVKGLISATTEIIKKNLRMDIYEDYFEANNNVFKEDKFSAKIKSVYKDNFPIKRSVNKLTWHPEDPHIVAASYKVKNLEQLSEKTKLNCLIWDINKPNAPLYTLNSNSEILTISFNSKHQNLIAAGCANGTIGIYDFREGKLVISTKNEDSHHEAVSDVVWLKSKNGTEFVSTSTDGKVIWWDNKTLKVDPTNPASTATYNVIEPEKPLFLTYKEGDIIKEYGGTKIEYHPESAANKFLIAAEQGTVFLASKKKGDSESTNQMGFKWGRHLGPITGIQRCPADPKFFLTVGDWTARIWPDDNKYPVFISKYHNAYLTDCLWSPTRHGIYFISRSDGWINAYDLCYKTSEPSFNYKVCDYGLTSMCINSKGNLIMVGDEDGKISLIKLSKSFHNINDNDNKEYKEFVSTMFARENGRERNIEASQKQKRGLAPRDETAKLAKQEQTIREKIRKIEDKYIPFVKDFFGKQLEFSDAKFEEKKRLDAQKKMEEKKLEEVRKQEESKKLLDSKSLEDSKKVENSQEIVQENPASPKKKPESPKPVVVEEKKEIVKEPVSQREEKKEEKEPVKTEENKAEPVEVKIEEKEKTEVIDKKDDSIIKEEQKNNEIPVEKAENEEVNENQEKAIEENNENKEKEVNQEEQNLEKKEDE